MSMRLGETLVQRGLLSEEQVKKALDAQLIYGAHLGTCLIELGMLGEETLGGVLSDIFGVPYARPSCFESIPEPVIGALPPRFAAKHHVVPIGVDDRLMRLAMIDPRNLHALDEVSFASGCRIEPWVSPEVRIQQALERYYDVPRRMRYVAMVRAGSSEATDRGSGSSAGAGAEAHAADPARRAGGHPAQMDPEEALARLCDRLCGAENADELAAAALDFVGARAERVLLFRVEGVAARLWMVRGVELARETTKDLRLSITSEPIFSLILGDFLYRGPLPEEPDHLAFYERLRIGLPGEVVLFPVHHQDRLAMILYADSGRAPAALGETELYRRLRDKLAAALALVACKNRLRSL